MTLATILVLVFLSVGSWSGSSQASAQDSDQSQSKNGTQAQSSPAQPASSGTPTSNAPTPGAASKTSTGQPQNPTSSDKSTPTHHAHRKKVSEPDCTNSSSTNGKPCPPAKVVVKNGGSDEPVVTLKGKTSEEQASYQRYTTEQLTAATEENLKKIAGRNLNESQQAMAGQIKQFMDQAKSAVADGDLNRARTLAMKAKLLSDELVKP
jgi:hypothetical protein